MLAPTTSTAIAIRKDWRVIPCTTRRVRWQALIFANNTPRSLLTKSEYVSAPLNTLCSGNLPQKAAEWNTLGFSENCNAADLRGRCAAKEYRKLHVIPLKYYVTNGLFFLSLSNIIKIRAYDLSCVSYMCQNFTKRALSNQFPAPFFYRFSNGLDARVISQINYAKSVIYTRLIGNR